MKSFIVLPLLGALLSIAGNPAQPDQRILSELNDGQTFILRGNTRPVVSHGLARDEGRVPNSQLLPRLSLHFALTASQQADLTQLLTAQQDRRSSRYLHFLSPEEYASRFGLADADLAKVTRWLESQGFSKVQASRSHTWISFSGTAGQAESAFQTSIHRYSLRGETHYANAGDPHLPKELEGVVKSVQGLHNFVWRPHAVFVRPDFTSALSGNHYIAPDDWATLYNVKPLYGAGNDGTGVTIAVVGQSDVQLTDIEAFRSASGLTAKDPTVLVPPGLQDPGFRSGDEAESDLDLEWSGAIARNANILFVTASATAGNGVNDAMIYAIDNNLAPIVSVSYGLCEPDMTTGEFQTLERQFQQANAQGMTIVASSGDSGATTCDYSKTETAATQGLAVSYPASSAYVTAIGGTEFNEGAGNYWNTTNNTYSGSVVSYIPEIAWNDGFQMATGGGVSVLEAKPAWQIGTGVPSDSGRDLPDISFASSPNHDGMLFCGHSFCSNGYRNAANNLDLVGGTSTGAPTFSGILALLIQSNPAGTRLGNINPNLYALAGTSSTIFHDITAGNNQQLCQTGTTGCPNGGSIGYVAATGYDQVTGWGSIDATNFTQQWFEDIKVTSTPTTLSITPGTSGTATISVTPLNNYAGKVTFACSVSSGLVDVTCSVPSTAITAPATAVVTITAAASAQSPLFEKFRMPTLSGVQLFTGVLLLILAGSFVCTLRFWKRPSYALACGTLLAVVTTVVSCGGGGSTTSTVGSGSSTSTPALTLSCNLPAGAMQGTAYSGQCSSTGGTGALTYSATTALPPGLNISTSTGAVSGTPTSAGTYNFTLGVSDSSSPVRSTSQTISSFVVAPSTLTISCTFPSGSVGAFYQGSCTGGGGTSPITYSITAGALPAGLSLNSSTGLVSGFPTTAGLATFTESATDSGAPQQTASQSISVTISQPSLLTVACPGPLTGQVGVAYSGSCVASGGNLPATFYLNTGSLPPGLALIQTSGSITGTPTTQGSSTFTVKALDSSSPQKPAISNPVTITIGHRPTETGIVTVTATSGGIVNSIAIAVTVPY